MFHRQLGENAGDGRLGRKVFFFEKKKQKTFISRTQSGHRVRDSETKVFCFFFSKKKFFLPYFSTTGSITSLPPSSRTMATW